MLRRKCFLVLFLFVTSVGGIANAQIQIDGQTNDWQGTPGLEGELVIDSGEAIWIDYIDDDKGDGDYEYPTWAGSVAWQNGTSYDIGEVRITADGDDMYFLVVANGPHLVTYGIFIDTGPGGREDIFFRGGSAPIDPFASPHIKLPPEIAWDVAALVCQSGGSAHRSLLNVTFDAGNDFQIIKEWEEFGACCGDATEDVYYEPDDNVMELRLPITSIAGATDGIPDPANKTYNFMVLIGLGQTGVPSGGIVAFGQVMAGAGEWEPGGADGPNAPYVFDMIGSTPQEQEEDLSEYTNNEVTTLQHSFISVKFDAQGEPEGVGRILVEPHDKLSNTWGNVKSRY